MLKQEKQKKNVINLAKAIISVMGNMQPHLRDVPDFQHKLMGSTYLSCLILNWM